MSMITTLQRVLALAIVYICFQYSTLCYWHFCIWVWLHLHLVVEPHGISALAWKA